MCPKIQRCTMSNVRNRLCCLAACSDLTAQQRCSSARVGGPGIGQGHMAGNSLPCRHAQQSKASWPTLAMHEARIPTNATSSVQTLACPLGVRHNIAKQDYIHHVICVHKAVPNSWRIQAMSSPRGRSKVLLMQRGQLAHVNRLAQPEVGQLHVPTCVQQQVVRLYIPATHVPRMQ